MANPIITKIQIEGNNVVSFLNGTNYVRSMSQILPQSPTYISYRYDTITISQVAGEPFTFSIYTVTDVGGNAFTELTIQDAADVVQARTVEVYRLLVTSIFKGCCPCGDEVPQCAIQYVVGDPGEPAPLAGEFVYNSGSPGSISFNYITDNNQDFTNFFPTVQDGSWIFLFSKTDPTVYAIIQVSNFSDQVTYAKFDAIELNAAGVPFTIGTIFCVDFTSVGGSLVQDWQDTLNISSILTQDNFIDGGAFNFQWDNVAKYILNSTNFQQYTSDDGSGAGFVRIDPGAVTLNATGYIDIITPGYPSASTGWVLALDASGHVEYVEAGTGTISSIELLMPPAFTVSDPNPLITDGTFTVTVDGTEDQYINGLGELADFPVYTVENGLHAFGGVPGEAPPDPFLFHLGGLLVEDTTITVTNGAAQYALGVAGLAGQDTQQPFGVSNLGQAGVATFQDYGSANRPNPSVEIVGDVDLFQPLLELKMEGNLPAGGILTDRNALLRLKYDGDPSLASMSIDYQFKNDDTPPNVIYFVGCRLTAEVTNFTANDEQSKFLMQLFDGGSRQTKMEMSGPGQLTLNEYATGSFSDGTTNIDNALSYVLGVDNTGKVWKKLAAGGGTVQSVGAAGLLTTTATNPFTVSGTVTTSVNENRLVGRWASAGTGIMQEITIGDGLTLSALGELTADGSVPAYDGDQGVYKDTSLTNDTFMLGAPFGFGNTIPFQEDREIDRGTFTLYTTSAAGSGIYMSYMTNSSGGSGIYVETNEDSITGYSPIKVGVTGIGNDAGSFAVKAGNKNGIGVETYSQSNYALNAITDNYVTAAFRRQPGSPIAAITDIIELVSSTNSTLGTGILTLDGGGNQASRLLTKWTTALDVSQFEIQTKPSGGSLSTNLAVKGTGQIQFNKYGTPGTFYDAAPVWALGVDASGNVVEIDPGGGGGTYDSDQGIYKDTSLTNDTFMLGAPLGSEAGIAFQVDRYIYTDDFKLSLRGNPTDDWKTTDGSILDVIFDASTSGMTAAGIKIDASATAGKTTGIAINQGLGIGVVIDGIGDGIILYSDGAPISTYLETLTGLNSVQPSYRMTRQTEFLDPAISNGFGTGIVFVLADGNSVVPQTQGVISFYYSDITPGTQAADMQFSVNLPGLGTGTPSLTLKGTNQPGQVQFNEYGTGAITGTPAYSLAVDSSGNVIEVIGSGPAPGLQDVITTDPILTANNTITGVGLDLKFDQLLNFEANATGTVKAYSFSGVNVASLEINTVASPFVDIYSTQSGGGFTGITLRDTRMEIKTPAYASKNVGDVLTLVDPLTGEAEWDTPTGGGGIPFGVASGTDTYAVSAGTASTYTDGDAYLVRFTNGNTGGSTLNVNGIGDADMYSNSDGLLIGGDIWAGAQMLCVYNSSLPGFQCIGTAPNSLFAYVTNAEATAITKGMAVFAFGGTGDRLTVKKALATGDSTSAQTVGIVYSSSIGANQKGIIIIQGELVDVGLFPTSGGGENWSDGEPVYLSATTAGAVTRVKQYAPNHLVYLGICVKASNGTGGRMYVRIQNGFELDELHNVQAQTPADKDTLWYDNTVTPKQWKTASVPSLSGTFSLGVTVDGSGGTITAGVKGYVRVPYACTINTWSILTGNSGAGATITFDIWRASNAIPTVGGSLVGGGTKPFLTSGSSQITSAAPSGWTSVTLAANDILGFNVETGAAVFSWANLQLLVTKI